jgi:hypothetical protein
MKMCIPLALAVARSPGPCDPGSRWARRMNHTGKARNPRTNHLPGVRRQRCQPQGCVRLRGMPGLWRSGLFLIDLLVASTALCEPKPTQPIVSGTPSVSVQTAGRTKSTLEFQTEEIIDTAYLRCFRKYEIRGKQLLLRMPFAQNEERWGSPGFVQRTFLGGKGQPDRIWPYVDSLLSSRHFAEYALRLELPGKKFVAFDIERRTCSVFSDPGLVAMLEGGPYPGTRTRVYVLKRGAVINEVDLYNYLYCVGAVGMDCSGFVYYIQKSIAESLGLDLDRDLAELLHVPKSRVDQLIGLRLFDPFFGHATRVRDRVLELRPGDVILFLGRVQGRGIGFRHSAVIQSIDLDQGLIRYLQCTDWAPQQERGVHESYIYFDATKPDSTLADSETEWTQEIFPTFPGEPGLRYWKDDGDRYRAYMHSGGSLVVRLDAVRALLESLDPDYYRQVIRLGGSASEGVTSSP